MSLGARGGAADFHDLMRTRIMEILLVASPYDAFVLEEAGHIGDGVVGFRYLDPHYGPGLTTAASGAEALALLGDGGRVDLVITGLHLPDMNGAELARRVAQLGIDVPVVLLAFDARAVTEFAARHDMSAIEQSFLWQGDTRILLAMIKCVEDRRNAPHDTRVMGVQVVILIEDNVRYYSSFLPVIYAELLDQTRRLISEGLNVSEKILRIRARPKILLCRTFEEAWDAFTAYEDDVIGVISDVEFPRDGRIALLAGVDFARRVRARWADVPVLLQSSNPEHVAHANDVGASFALKGSPVLLTELRRFITEYFGFGDFAFRMRDGSMVARAHDLRSLEEKLGVVPAESIAYHAEHNHFSVWLKARTEFALALEVRPRRVAEFGGGEGIRRWLIDTIARYRHERSLAVVADFDGATFAGWDGDARNDFARIGGGSLGGKARGLAFMRRLLSEHRVTDGLGDDIEISVPGAVVLATDVFDRFLEDNNLRNFAIHNDDDHEMERLFVSATFPEDARADLAAFVARVSCPLAVRSSSLLEDSQHQPFSGVYETFMLPNNQPTAAQRLDELLRAVARVYASTFSRRAKDYMRATHYRLEEERMAVIVQRIVGSAHGERFYPDCSGVARSHDFYPTAPHTAADGIAAIALGLGRSVVADGNCVRFSPRYPQHFAGFSSVADVLANSQRAFWALDLSSTDNMRESRFELDLAEADGTLAAVASTYSAENDAVFEGVSRPGARMVTFASMLKHRTFPLAEALDRLLALGTWAMGSAVEIEVACKVSVARGDKREFAFLQLRPLTLSHESAELHIASIETDLLVCRCKNVLGHGKIDDIHDIVVVDSHRFERAASRETAAELAQFNAELAGRPYLLIGVGRWGSADPWLGIPVTWEQISGARVIVEAGFQDFKVTPSQGTHFFQNLTTFNVGYFTVNPDAGDGFVDWPWLASQRCVRETSCVRHVRCARPLVVQMNGQQGEGVILKPA